MGLQAVEADISTTTGPDALIDAAAEEFGKIDILINNASLAVNKPLEEQTLDDWDMLVNLNGRGTFLLTKAALKHLSKGSKPNQKCLSNTVLFLSLPTLT